MRKLLKALFGIFLGFLISCSGEDDSMTISVSPQRSFVLPGSGYKCSGGEKQGGYRLLWTTIDLNFKRYDLEDLYVVYMKVTVPGRNLVSDISCVMDDVELYVMYRWTSSQTGTLPILQNSTYYNGTGKATNGGCTLRCFGVSPSDEEKGFTLSGELKVFAYGVDKVTQEQYPYSARTTVQIQYVP